MQSVWLYRAQPLPCGPLAPRLPAHRPPAPRFFRPTDFPLAIGESAENLEEAAKEDLDARMVALETVDKKTLVSLLRMEANAQAIMRKDKGVKVVTTGDRSSLIGRIAALGTDLSEYGGPGPREERLIGTMRVQGALSSIFQPQSRLKRKRADEAPRDAPGVRNARAGTVATRKCPVCLQDNPSASHGCKTCGISFEEVMDDASRAKKCRKLHKEIQAKAHEWCKLSGGDFFIDMTMQPSKKNDSREQEGHPESIQVYSTAGANRIGSQSMYYLDELVDSRGETKTILSCIKGYVEEMKQHVGQQRLKSMRHNAWINCKPPQAELTQCCCATCLLSNGLGTHPESTNTVSPDWAKINSQMLSAGDLTFSTLQNLAAHVMRTNAVGLQCALNHARKTVRFEASYVPEATEEEQCLAILKSMSHAAVRIFFEDVPLVQDHAHLTVTAPGGLVAET